MRYTLSKIIHLSAAVCLLSAMCFLTGCGGKKTPAMPLTAEDPNGRTVLTLDIYTAAYPYYQVNVQESIALFNRTNPDYFVQAITYEGLEAEDYLTARSLKILTGRCADILYLGYEPRLCSYIEKGVLEPLDDYLERDVRQEDYLAHTFDMYRVDGKAYAVPISFCVNLYTGTKEMFGEEKDYPFAEFCELTRQADPDSLFGLPPIATLRDMYTFFHLDPSDPEELKNGILLADQYRYKKHLNEDGDEDDDITLARLGYRPMMTNIRISSPLAMIITENTFGTLEEECVPVNKAMLNSFSLGVSSYSKNKEGAWEFLRFMLSEERQLSSIESEDYDDSCHPVLKKALQQETEQSFAAISKIYGERFTEDEDLSMERYLRITEDYFARGVPEDLRSDHDVWLILQEEAAAYYDGIKGIEETVDAIGHRLKMYYLESARRNFSIRSLAQAATSS